jgi:sec-independent protein translocase protein TatB
MFEVGFTEMLLIGVLALVVLGPERLPRVAAQLGRWAGKARSVARGLREQLEAEAASLDASHPETTRNKVTSSIKTSSPDRGLTARQDSKPSHEPRA